MVFNEMPLKGAYVIELEKIEDERGFFARSWCMEEFKKYGLSSQLVQLSISYNKRKGTLRGMHYQIRPYEEDKLVRCTQGAIYDVIADLRPNSVTYKQWISIELTSENRKTIYIPKGFAHGYQTLVDNTEVLYQMTEFFHPECARGFRWDDPIYNIIWPIEERITSDKDRNF
ncbi:dTDP-4-dehydrorhamnose 3,5-epimerase [Acetobacterium sp. K1/6]|uniref:dTDP-4-dehydrorhamnose 3,5-epimerase n=1 Tax=Acetobacterium sp. K1/6 TaxID=3055467 RepID=UPI002ACA899E|nr:dTDP-4-dehydrorhamnose 3,5-epimerase [Acetobacterium sp. K1/6]MDZ5724897.1 dTDP-4-dehydrorhamnose 3,5-epimerase [Acetobacterium sp. K1/6]